MKKKGGVFDPVSYSKNLIMEYTVRLIDISRVSASVGFNLGTHASSHSPIHMLD